MSSYGLGLARSFAASHYFQQKEGPEGVPHTHHYRMEIQLHGDELDSNGYLVDLDEVETLLNAVLGRYTGVLLNGLPEFSNLSPSLEHLATVLCRAVSQRLNARMVKAVAVKLWENEWAWASFHEESR